MESEATVRAACGASSLIAGPRKGSPLADMAAGRRAGGR